MRVATYRDTGPFRGRVVELKKIEGAQQWRVRLSARRSNGATEEHDIRSPTPLLLSDMRELVFKSIAELCGPGEKLEQAEMDFFVIQGKAA